MSVVGSCLVMPSPAEDAQHHAANLLDALAAQAFLAGISLPLPVERPCGLDHRAVTSSAPRWQTSKLERVRERLLRELAKVKNICGSGGEPLQSWTVSCPKSRLIGLARKETIFYPGFEHPTTSLAHGSVADIRLVDWTSLPDRGSARFADSMHDAK